MILTVLLWSCANTRNNKIEIWVNDKNCEPCIYQLNKKFRNSKVRIWVKLVLPSDTLEYPSFKRISILKFSYADSILFVKDTMLFNKFKVSQMSTPFIVFFTQTDTILQNYQSIFNKRAEFSDSFKKKLKQFK